MKFPATLSSRVALAVFALLLLLGMVSACGQTTPDEPSTKEKRTTALFDLEKGWSTSGTFFNAPFPSNFRVDDQGAADWTGFPNPKKNGLIRNLTAKGAQKPGFSVLPVGFFRFSAKLSKHDFKDVVSAAPSSPALLIDVTKSSEEYGSLFPVTLHSFEASTYVPTHLLAVALAPGIVLKPKRTYAIVVMSGLLDSQGKKLAASAALQALKEGRAPVKSSLGERLQTLYSPLWPALRKAKVKLEEVVAATVLTTRDSVQSLYALSEGVRKRHQPSIENLRLDPDDGAKHEKFCELKGTIRLPQFQKGIPPYDKEGLFVLDDQGIPKEQRKLEVPVTITVPKEKMPAEGYPLVLYVHGSGGRDLEAVDRGPKATKNGPTKKGEGPAFELAPYGIGTVSQAMPVNPQRIKTGNPFAYINFENPAAFRDTFQQGVLELRLLLDAMGRLRIKPDALKGCEGPSLPAGAPAYQFSSQKIGGSGQSMGAMYLTMLTAVEKRIKLAVPTGGGGYLSYFVYSNRITLFQPPIIRTLISAGKADKLVRVHPVLQLLQLVWEPSDPVVYAKRISQRPLSGFSPRHLFQPLGENDSFFMEPLFDVMTSSFGNQLAGTEIWPGTQRLLKSLLGLDKGSFPLTNNRKSEDGRPYTGVAVQFKPDPVTGNGHYVAFNRPDVKTVYTCFFHSFFKTGKATVLAPGKTCSK